MASVVGDPLTLGGIGFAYLDRKEEDARARFGQWGAV